MKKKIVSILVILFSVNCYHLFGMYNRLQSVGRNFALEALDYLRNSSSSPTMQANQNQRRRRLVPVSDELERADEPFTNLRVDVPRPMIPQMQFGRSMITPPVENPTFDIVEPLTADQASSFMNLDQVKSALLTKSEKTEFTSPTREKPQLTLKRTQMQTPMTGLLPSEFNQDDLDQLLQALSEQEQVIENLTIQLAGKEDQYKLNQELCLEIDQLKGEARKKVRHSEKVLCKEERDQLEQEIKLLEDQLSKEKENSRRMRERLMSDFQISQADLEEKLANALFNTEKKSLELLKLKAVIEEKVANIEALEAQLSMLEEENQNYSNAMNLDAGLEAKVADLEEKRLELMAEIKELKQWIAENTKLSRVFELHDEFRDALSSSGTGGQRNSSRSWDDFDNSASWYDQAEQDYAESKDRRFYK